MDITAGVLLIFISVAHNIYGEKNQIPALKKLTDDSIMIGSLRIMIFQGGLLLFAVGVIQILTSIDIIELVGVARYFPVGIVLINFGTAISIAALGHRDVLKIMIPQMVLFVIIIGLQFISI